MNDPNDLLHLLKKAIAADSIKALQQSVISIFIQLLPAKIVEAVAVYPKRRPHRFDKLRQFLLYSILFCLSI